MMRFFIIAVFTMFIAAPNLQAQENGITWVQLEAQPSLSLASERVRLYSRDLQDVNGFYMGDGWYAIALGPYTRTDAEQVLSVYRAEGIIPRDSYLTESSPYRSQFWPVGSNLLNVTLDTATLTTEIEPDPIDETPNQARASEAELTRDERKQLQVYLQWGGYYDSAIDGAFGRGTRGSMSAWQADNNYESTGILTTRQREELRQQYYAVLKGMDLRTVANHDAGIEMLLPMGVLTNGATEFPFVRYDASGALPAQALLISQAGDQTTLFGLYEIMQTLKIIPLNGPRERKNKSFTLTGQNRDIVSYTEVTLENGEIKGFTLVWPTGDEERRDRILNEMRASFKRLDGVLDPAAGGNEVQNIDLVAGLEIRKPKIARSGFFVDSQGSVATTLQAVQDCERITIDNDYPAKVTAIDENLGVALLRPAQQLAPISVASFAATQARLQSEVAVAGYSFEGVLGAPTMTFGTLADSKGLKGEEDLRRLALAALPGDAGGPVFDTGGTVLGMLLPEPDKGARQLPEDVRFAASGSAIAALLAASGFTAQTIESGPTLAPEDLTSLASDVTVLVSCW